MSPDFSTLSGVSLCKQQKCDLGGGEFILRRDRTEFVVEGAGDPKVNGVYTSKAPYEGSPKTTSSTHRLYDGSPIYVQKCPREIQKNLRRFDDDPSCDDDPFAIVHVVVGQFGFWRIQRSSSIGQDHDDELRYSVCSEEVYPPDVGWRAANVDRAPPPRVRPSVASMYDLKNYAGGQDDDVSDTRFFSIALLLVIGGLLWTLVFLLIKVRVKGGGHPKKGDASVPLLDS